jgi:A/G-specific adenine glycosylase
MTDSASHTLNHPFTADLLKWYTEAAADLPWRRSRDPYRVWLSEIMLQQTQVATVIPYFERFIAAYPDVRALAAAPLAAVLKCWEGLGYYSRARNLHRAAQEVVNACDGKFPTSAAALIKLPGIGRYTANAIASIAFGERVAALDGNVIRVLSRLYDIPDEVSQPKTQERLWMLAEALITDESVQEPGEYNQAMMELGREICRPRKPRCGVCPVREHCAALAAGTQSERPNKRRDL